jgi:hypothetical protein
MTERLKYEVLRRLGQVEIRRYPRATYAAVDGMPDDEAFGILFEYIAGGNSSGRRIEMTAPVMSTADSFAFVMPQGMHDTSLPTPHNERISIVETPERVVAVLRFRGRTRPRDVKGKEEELLSTLRQAGVLSRGDVLLLRYNPPFVPGFLRTNEVGIEVLPPPQGAVT